MNDVERLLSKVRGQIRYQEFDLPSLVGRDDPAVGHPARAAPAQQAEPVELADDSPAAANGHASAQVNGHGLNGKAMNGRSLNGAAHDGAALNGKTHNGKPQNGAALNGAGRNGTSHNGAARPAHADAGDIRIDLGRFSAQHRPQDAAAAGDLRLTALFGAMKAAHLGQARGQP